MPKTLFPTRTTLAALLVAGLAGCGGAPAPETSAAATSAAADTARTAAAARTTDAGGQADQELTFTGAVDGTMPRAGLGTSQYLKGCVHTDTSYSLDIAGEVGGTRYELSVTMAGTYQGPKTYTIDEEFKLNSAVGVSVDSVPDDGSLELVGRGGTFTVAADERSGTIDAPLVGANAGPARGHVSGTWHCPPAG